MQVEVALAPLLDTHETSPGACIVVVTGCALGQTLQRLNSSGNGQVLYESSLAFGLRKVLQAEDGKEELVERTAAAEAQAVQLRDQARPACLRPPPAYLPGRQCRFMLRVPCLHANACPIVSTWAWFAVVILWAHALVPVGIPCRCLLAPGMPAR